MRKICTDFGVNAALMALDSIFSREDHLPKGRRQIAANGNSGNRGNSDSSVVYRRVYATLRFGGEVLSC